jgi:hypothetical protein
MWVTVFRDAATSVGRQAELTWSQLYEILARGSNAETKDKLAGWCPARFRERHRRGAKTIDVWAMVADIDNKAPKDKGGAKLPNDEIVTVERMLAALQGQEAFIYTSFSHTTDWPRFRVVVPLDRPLPPGEYSYCWTAFANWLAGKGITIDTSTKDPNRLWYLGARNRIKTWLQVGAPLNTDRYLAAARAEMAAEKKFQAMRPTRNCHDESNARVRRYLAKCPASVSGESGHVTAFSVIRCVVRGFDLGEDEALTALVEWNDRCDPPWSVTELQHKIRQSRKVGRTPKIGEYNTKSISTSLRLPRPKLTADELAAMGVDVEEVSGV